jgi:hypothetical protein
MDGNLLYNEGETHRGLMRTLRKSGFPEAYIAKHEKEFQGECGSFDATIYHKVDPDNFPPSRAFVPVKIMYDWGNIECMMVAGLTGMRVTSSGKDLHGKPGKKGLDTISIEPGWWMYEKQVL